MAASASPIQCRPRPAAAVSFQELASVVSELQLASSWDRRAPARALRVIKSHSLGLKKLAPTPLFRLLQLLANEKPDALDIQVLAGALGVFAWHIAMADDVRWTQAGDMADEHRT